MIMEIQMDCLVLDTAALLAACDWRKLLDKAEELDRLGEPELGDRREWAVNAEAMAMARRLHCSTLLGMRLIPK